MTVRENNEAGSSHNVMLVCMMWSLNVSSTQFCHVKWNRPLIGRWFVIVIRSQAY